MIGRHAPSREASFAVLALALLLAAALAARSPARADRPGLVVAVDSGPASLDPRQGSDEGSRRFYDLVFNALYRTGDDARPVPDLASAAAWSDATTLAVTLREGIRFHDG